MTVLGAEGLLSNWVEGHLSFKSQNKFSRLSFYQVSTHLSLLKKLSLINLWHQGALQGLPSSFYCVWSWHGEEVPQCGWVKIDLWGGVWAASWDRGTAPTSEWLRLSL